jgi:glycosyltransferase involved in cell wall biosynthesis/Tfp pilus assembly protein PilF
MSWKYLVGPLSAQEAWRSWRGPRSRGECRAFNARNNLDLTVAWDDTWQDVVGRLPDGWRPDFVVLDLAEGCVPPALWRAPVPLVALARGWDRRWHPYRHLLPHCDAALADGPGAALLSRAGLEDVRPARLCGLPEHFLGLPLEGPERDIDVLFVGTAHPAYHWRRLAWLGRLAALGGRRRVALCGGLPLASYQDLLRRARVVFDVSDTGSCSRRALEAAASGALLFQEAGNAELPRYLEPGKEYIAYAAHDLEHLLEHYLTHEDERRGVAEAGRERVQGYSCDALWKETLSGLGQEWPALAERCRRRLEAGSGPDLLARLAQAVVSPEGGDVTLVRDLADALAGEPRAAALHHALGLARVLEARAGGRTSLAAGWEASRHFQQALAAEPRHAVAAAALVEVLASDTQGRAAVAAEGARQVLAILDRGLGLEGAVTQALPFPADLGLLREEWERAGWEHAGDVRGEAEAKARLLRWRLHALLGRLSDKEPEHYARAALARPDLPTTQAAYGCALARAGRAGEAIPFLRQEVLTNPLDREAARALFQVLSDAGQGDEARRLAADRLLLHRAAPQAAPAEPWFTEPGRSRPATPTAAGQATSSPPAAAPGRPAVVWEGAQAGLHSLGLVNRELCRRLAARGVDLSLVPREFPPEAGVPEVPLPPELAALVRRPLGRPADVTVRHAWPPDFRPPESGRWVLIQPWEFGSLPKAWVGPIAEMVDEVWAYTQAVRDCYVQSGVPAERVRVVPLGVDAECFRPGAEPYPLRTGKGFKFLFVGGTIWRKGFDVLLDAYGRSFSAADDVCLVVKDMGAKSFYKGQTAGDLLAQFRARPDAPEVEYLDGDLSPQEMAGLYGACDCLAQPYRGEGFGLPIAEAMACALPVVVTGHGAALDYCDDTRAYLVPARVVHLPERRIGDLETVDHPFVAEPDIGALADLLHHVLAHPEEARARGRAASDFVRARLTWEHAAEVVLGRLEELRRRPVLRLAGPSPAPSAPPARRRRVSLCMIVKDEEQNLPACLESAADLFDEVVIVDTGSTDRTREVAASFGAQVHEFPWQDSFAAARNESLARATGDWVFWLDADDRLDGDNRARLRALLAGLGDDNAAYSVKCLCLPDAVTGAATVVDHIRLFRNRPDVRWRYRVHEQILPSVRQAGGRVRWGDVVVHHAGYCDPTLRRRKLQRDLRLLGLEDAEHPDDPFTLFNLGSVHQELGQHAEALPFLRRSLEKSHPADSIVRKLFALIVGCHRALGQAQEAAAACAAGLRVCPGDTELLFLDSLLRQDRGDAAGSEAALRRLLGEQPGAHFASVDAGLRGHKGRHNLAVLCLKQGRLAEAEALWRRATRERPDFLPAWVGLGECLLRRGEAREFEEVTQHLETLPGGGLEVALLRGRSLMARREFRAARALVEGACARQPEALPLRVLLSHVLLQEGRDLPAAEAALRAVLEQDPSNAEARHNLALLLGQRQQAADQALNGPDAPLALLFERACAAPEGIHRDLPTLHALAKGCRHVTELGTGSGASTTALLYARPEVLVCYDLVRLPEMDRLEGLAGPTRWVFRQEDVLQADIEETDLLSIDTRYLNGRLEDQLGRHAGRVRRYLVLHGTTANGDRGEGGGQPGLWPALEGFLSRAPFRLRHRHDNEDLIVLERMPTRQGEGVGVSAPEGA